MFMFVYVRTQEALVFCFDLLYIVFFTLTAPVRNVSELLRKEIGPCLSQNT